MLYIVPTPIGNLEDLSPRARRALAESRAVLCEDTRWTRKLLSHHAIRTPLYRYRDDAPRVIEASLRRLEAGEDLALVSDAGTPVISDPGFRLVRAARERGLPVTSLPGPCAAVAAVAGSGLPGDSFVFLGFLPRGAGKRRKALEAAGALEKTIVVYESPYRIAALLEDAAAALGPRAQGALCRELSKIHEEWLLGSVEQLQETISARLGDKRSQGEFVCVFHPRPAGAAAPEPEEDALPPGPEA